MNLALKRQREREKRGEERHAQILRGVWTGNIGYRERGGDEEGEKRGEE